MKSLFIPLHTYLTIFCYSQKDESEEEKKRRTCRAGAGIEATCGMCNTPGFELKENPELLFDHRGYYRINLPRNHQRLVQSSTILVQSTRANGDVSPLLYEFDPMSPNPGECNKVVGYTVDYATKSTETERETKIQMGVLIKSEEATMGGKWDITRVTVRAMNQLIQQKLTSRQEACCIACGLCLWECSNTIDKFNINEYQSMDENENITKSKKFFQYANRHKKLENKSFYEFLIATKNTKKTQNFTFLTLLGKVFMQHFPSQLIMPEPC